MFETQVGTLRLSSPLLLASGYITETPDFFLEAQRYGCAAMVTRSLKEHVPPERQRIPVPRYAVRGTQTMLNAEWGNERPWTEWRDKEVKRVHDAGAPLILSLSGRDIESCLSLIRAFDAVGVDAYEINVSCSHSGSLHGDLNTNLDHLRMLMISVRASTNTPIWIKLSYSTMLIPMAKLAEELGADAIVCTNSIGPGLLIDPLTGRPQLGTSNGAGGVTGPAIFPIALRCVFELCQTLRIPVVGVGGIETAEDVIQMFMAGASAVQLYTVPALKGPKAFRKITNGLQRYFDGHPTFRTPEDLRGITQRFTGEHRFEVRIPAINETRCTGCTLCVPACAFKAITIDNRKKAVILPDACVGCNACIGACPPRFAAITAVYD